MRFFKIQLKPKIIYFVFYIFNLIIIIGTFQNCSKKNFEVNLENLHKTEENLPTIIDNSDNQTPLNNTLELTEKSNIGYPVKFVNTAIGSVLKPNITYIKPISINGEEPIFSDCRIENLEETPQGNLGILIDPISCIVSVNRVTPLIKPVPIKILATYKDELLVDYLIIDSNTNVTSPQILDSDLNHTYSIKLFTNNKLTQPIIFPFRGDSLDCTVEPDLPPGLILKNCAIVGNPIKENWNSYIISAFNTAGTVSINLELDIKDRSNLNSIDEKIEGVLPSQIEFDNSKNYLFAQANIKGFFPYKCEIPSNLILPIGVFVDPSLCAIMGVSNNFNNFIIIIKASNESSSVSMNTILKTPTK